MRNANIILLTSCLSVCVFINTEKSFAYVRPSAQNLISSSLFLLSDLRLLLKLGP